MKKRTIAEKTLIDKRLKDNMEELNRRFIEAKKESYQNLSIFKEYKEKFEAVSGKTSKKGLAVLGKARGSYTRKEDLLNLSERFLESKWTTSEGREKIWEKSFDTFSNNRGGVDKDAWLKSLDVFTNDGYSKAVEMGFLQSEQIIAVMENNEDSTRANEIIEKVLSIKQSDKENRIDKKTMERIMYKSLNDKKNWSGKTVKAKGTPRKK